MRLSEGELARMEWAALSLGERLASGERFPADPGAGEALLERLCEALGGNGELLDRRLGWEGWTRDDVRRVAGRGPESRPPGPRWGDTLNEMLECFEAVGSTRSPILEPDAPVPFEEVITPFTGFGMRRLLANVGSASLLGERARASLERWLLIRLASLSVPAMEHDFTDLRKRRRPLALLRARFGRPRGSTDLYREFVEGMRDGGLASFFASYPVLARRVVATVDLWEGACAEMLERLQRDLPVLEARFNAGGRLGTVARLVAGVSDAHDGGRSVALLEFESGVTVVYKPRALEPEAAWNRFLARLNAAEPTLELRTFEVLCGDGYGWAEHVPYRACGGEGDLARYYRGAGRLLAALYALKVFDCHDENVVACGDHPVVVDLETMLFQPLLWHAGEDPDPFSVTDTGLLPSGTIGPDGCPVDQGGLGCSLPDPVRERSWAYVNTDDMSLLEGTERGEGGHNVPFAGGGPALPPGTWEAVTVGFAEAYRVILARRGDLLAGPLMAFADLPIRVVTRSTQVYGDLLERCGTPDAMRDGLAGSVVLERLGRAFVRESERPRLWGVFGAEVRSLERGDVPRFQTTGGGRSLSWAGGEIVPDAFAETSFESLRTHVHALGEADLELQSAPIRAALLRET